MPRTAHRLEAAGGVLARRRRAGNGVRSQHGRDVLARGVLGTPPACLARGVPSTPGVLGTRRAGNGGGRAENGLRREFESKNAKTTLF